MKCQRCGLPQVAFFSAHAGPQCKCWATFKPADPAPQSGCQPLQPLTEADVRRIVREELARVQPAPTDTPKG